jgi:hypothetical protein
MTRFLTTVLIATLAASGCASTKRLSDTEYDHYYALRDYMTEDQKKTYLKYKTEEERNAYLQEIGVWDIYYKYDEATRAEIIAGDVQLGWTKDMVIMSWGAPYDKQKVAGRDTPRSERYVYRFEGHSDGTIYLWTENSKTVHKATRLFRKEVILDMDVVAEITEKEDWQ